MSRESNRIDESKSGRITFWLTRYVYLSGTIFIAMGFLMLLAAWDDDPMLKVNDALLGVATQTVLLATGVLHLAIGAYIFGVRNLTNQGLAALWLGGNHAVYFLGVKWLQTATPLPVFQVLGRSIETSPNTLNTLWKVLIMCLIIGGVLVIALRWRQLRKIEEDAFISRWRKMRGRPL